MIKEVGVKGKQEGNLRMEGSFKKAHAPVWLSGLSARLPVNQKVKAHLIPGLQARSLVVGM